MKRFNYKFQHQRGKGKVIVAPLFWGLGHATRCIPVVNALLAEDYQVVIASDGGALKLLNKEFPALETIELPSYNISYPKKGQFLKVRLLLQLPHIQQTARAEKKVIKEYVAQNQVVGIISDNRFGVRHKEIPSVFITHQLNVLSGNTSWLTGKAHKKVIKKFDQCWVPDIEGPGNLSGRLGHLEKPLENLRYIGPLSRMNKRNLPEKYELLFVLSGPEPQRSVFEEKIRQLFASDSRKALLVRGVVETKQKWTRQGEMEVVNYLTSGEIETAINQSRLVISRSGYTTIMDLSALGKKAFFVPTPGQYEQEYLAKRLKSKGLVPCCRQERFGPDQLSQVVAYRGLQPLSSGEPLSGLFGLFEREGEL